MQLVLHLAKKVPMDKYPQEIVDELESKLEDIAYVHTAQFNGRSLKVSIIYIDPLEHVKDDYSVNDIDIDAFRSAIRLNKYFSYVGISA